MQREICDVVIIGGGPAGLAAAIYAGRAKLRAVLLEKLAPGGQLLGAEMIENYPGFLAIEGPELARRMDEQARASGADIRNQTAIEVRRTNAGWLVRTDAGTEYVVSALIFCAGGSPRKLGVPGEAEFAGRGVSYCALCDGPLFRDQVIAVVGGGDSAFGESIYLARYAKEIHILNNDDDLEASPILQERVFANPKITVHMNSVVEEIGGGERVQWVRIRNPKDGSIRRLDVSGVFVYIGFRPNSELVKDIVKIDERGYVVTDWLMRTSAQGVFAAGDVVAYPYRQITNAVAQGTTAALEAYKYVQELRQAKLARRAA